MPRQPTRAGKSCSASHDEASDKETASVVQDKYGTSIGQVQDSLTLPLPLLRCPLRSGGLAKDFIIMKAGQQNRGKAGFDVLFRSGTKWAGAASSG